MKPLISVILIFFVISPARAESIILKTKEEKQFPVQFSVSQTNSAPTALYIAGLGGKVIKYLLFQNSLTKMALI